MNETELFEIMKEKLYTPVVGDILDAKGYMHQFLPQNIRPLRDDMKIAGKAMTVLMIDVFGEQKKPFGRLCECLDQIQPNEIYIATGGTKRCAYWAYCNSKDKRRKRCNSRWLAQRYTTGIRAELAGILNRLLCTGFKCAYTGCRFQMSDRNRPGNDS